LPELTPTRRIVGQSRRVQLQGTWLEAAGQPLALNHLRLTNTPDAWFETTFYGTGMRWVCLRVPGFGKATITLNGRLFAQVDVHSGTSAYQQPCFSARGLVRGKYHVRVTSVPDMQRRLFSLEMLEIEP